LNIPLFSPGRCDEIEMLGVQIGFMRTCLSQFECTLHTHQCIGSYSEGLLKPNNHVSRQAGLAASCHDQVLKAVAKRMKERGKPH